MKKKFFKGLAVFIALCTLLSALELAALADATVPSVTTGSVSSITSTGASLDATVSDGGATATVSFQYGASTSYGSTQSATPATISAGTGTTTVSAALTGLTPNATYHYRIAATNSVGTSYSADATFTTLPDAPTGVTATAGSGSVSISFTPSTSDGGATIDCYLVTSSNGQTATGTSSPITVTGLTNGTPYTFTVQAHNSTGYSAASSASSSVTPVASQTITFETPSTQTYGSTLTLNASASSGLAVTYTTSTPGIISFTSGSTIKFIGTGAASITASQAGNSTYSAATDVTRTFTVNAAYPTATTGSASSISSSGATLGGTVNANAASTTVTFEYGTSTSYGSTATASQSPVTGSSDSSVSAILTGLASGTTYHFRIATTNSAGTTYGADATFTTLSSDAKLASLAISSGTLSPTFSSTTTAYSLSTYSAAITVTPTANNSNATITVNGTAVTSGSASGSITVTYFSGTTITILVTAQDGTTNTYTITVIGTLNINTDVYYAVTASAGTGGNISPSGKRYVIPGNNATFTITPKSGYAISDVVVDGTSVGAVSSYTISNVRTTHSINATFVKSDPFSDVSSSASYYSSVLYVYKNGIMTGTSSTTFNPSTGLTKAMFVTLLYRMSGEESSDSCSFSDVSYGSWYYEAVAWASANDIVNGIGDGTFGTNATITKEQLAVILYRYAEYEGIDVSVGKDTNILSYTDAESVSEYAIEAMQWALGSGAIDCDSDYIFPRDTMSRADTAVILTNFLIG